MSHHASIPIPIRVLDAIAGAGGRGPAGGQAAGAPVPEPADGHPDRAAPAIVVIEAAADMTDEDSAVELFRTARDEISEPRRAALTILLDLTNVRRADTKLVAYLVQLRRLADMRGAVIELLPSAHLLDLLRVCRLECLASSVTRS